MVVMSNEMTGLEALSLDFTAQVRERYERWLPERLAEIPESERDSFYSTLAEEIAERVQSLELALRGPDPEDEPFMKRLGRFNMARLQAIEMALAELLPAPEPEEDPEDLLRYGPGDRGGARPGPGGRGLRGRDGVLAAAPPPEGQLRADGADRLARFGPSSQADLAPSGELARVRANLAAVTTLRALEAEDRPATPDEQAVLARWSGWGAVPGVFDERDERFAEARAELRAMLDEDEYRAASRNTLNAHYTDAAYVQAIWAGYSGSASRAGGCWSRAAARETFIGFAPAGAEMTGVELDPTTAGICRALYPGSTVLAESFADTRAPEGFFDAAVGNVPFGRFALSDPVHNPGGHSVHNHFLLKSLHLTRPGGMVALLTSRYTLDAQNPAARRELAQLGDLVFALRLPEGAHRRAAGTDAVTDLVVFRRRAPRRGAGRRGLRAGRAHTAC